MEHIVHQMLLMLKYLEQLFIPLFNKIKYYHLYHHTLLCFIDTLILLVILINIVLLSKKTSLDHILGYASEIGTIQT